MCADLTSSDGYVVENFVCRCLKHNGGAAHQVSLRVKQDHVAFLTKLFGGTVYSNEDYAIGECNEAMKDEPNLSKGNNDPNGRRVLCSGCKKTCLTFRYIGAAVGKKEIDESRPVRLKNHQFPVGWVDHTCRKKNEKAGTIAQQKGKSATQTSLKVPSEVASIGFNPASVHEAQSLSESSSNSSSETNIGIATSSSIPYPISNSVTVGNTQGRTKDAAMAQGNRPAHQSRKKVVDPLTQLQDNQIRLMATLAQLQDNQIRLRATLAQRDAEVEKLNKILEDEEKEFRNLAADIAFDPWPHEHESNSFDSDSSGSNTRGYIMDVPMVQKGDQQQGHYQGKSNAIPHDGIDNLSPHDWEMVAQGLGYYNESAIAFDYTSGDNESNGKKRRYAIPSRQKSPSYDSVSDFSQNFRTISKINPHLSGGNLGCGSRSGNTNDQSTHTGTSFLIKRSEGVLEMLDEHKNWSPEKAQLTKDLIQAFANLFTTSHLQHGSSSATIVVYAKTITGDTIPLGDVMPDSTVEELKLKIQREEGVLLDQQCLIFLGEELENGQTLLDYGIVNKSRVDLLLKLEGRGSDSKAEEYDADVSSLSNCVDSSSDGDDESGSNDDVDFPSESSIGISAKTANVTSTLPERLLDLENSDPAIFPTFDNDGPDQYHPTDSAPDYSFKDDQEPTAISSPTHSATNNNYDIRSNGGGDGVDGDHDCCDGENIRSEAVMRGNNMACYPFSSEVQDGDDQVSTLVAEASGATNQTIFDDKKPICSSKTEKPDLKLVEAIIAQVGTWKGESLLIEGAAGQRGAMINDCNADQPDIYPIKAAAEQETANLITLLSSAKSDRVEDFLYPASKLPVLKTVHKNMSLGYFGSSLEILAHGSLCDLYCTKYNKTTVVVKILRGKYLASPFALNEICMEQNILACVSHENIINMIGTGESPFIALEYLGGGTLDLLLHGDRKSSSLSSPLLRLAGLSKKKQIFSSLKERLLIARDIASALDYLHERCCPDACIIHRDLKPVNIGFTKDMKLKLFDFGLATCVKRTTLASDVYQMTGLNGSLRYMAPEVALKKPYNQKVDVYSFGILLWEMLTGKKPFRGLCRDEFYCDVVGRGYRPNIPEAFPAVLSNLLRDCWREELVARPSFESILATLNTVLVESDPNASSISSSSEISPKKSPGGWSMWFRSNIQRVKPGGMPSAESSPRKISDLPALVDP